MIGGVFEKECIELLKFRTIEKVVGLLGNLVVRKYTDQSLSPMNVDLAKQMVDRVVLKRDGKLEISMRKTVILEAVMNAKKLIE